MEVPVGDCSVLLATHKTLRDDGSGGVVEAVAAYKPFTKYAATCAERGPIPSAFIIRHVTRVAQRVLGVVMDVECATCTGPVTQTVSLSENSPVILLPVATVLGTPYALLVRQRRVSAGCRFAAEALCGALGDDGRFTGPHDERLTALGFDLSRPEALGAGRFTVGNEGAPPYAVCRVAHALEPEALRALQGAPTDAAAALVAVRLDEVIAAVDDAKASLAASLILGAPEAAQ